MRWAGLAEDLDVVVNQHAFVNQGEAGGADEFVSLEDRGGEEDVESLPFAGRAGGVYEGRCLAVDGGVGGRGVVKNREARGKDPR